MNKEVSNKIIDDAREKIARKYWLAHISHARLSNPRIPEYGEMDFYKQKLINHKMFYDFADQILVIKVEEDEPHYIYDHDGKQQVCDRKGCFACNGTGKLPGRTLKQVLEEL